MKERQALKIYDTCALPLNALDRNFDLALLRLGFLLAVVAAPGPLDLNSGNVVDCEAVVLKKAPCQSHLKSRLDQRCAVVFEALVLVFVQNVEWRGKELLPQSLSRCVMHLHLRSSWM